jgi:hypothetical protein
MFSLRGGLPRHDIDHSGGQGKQVNSAAAKKGDGLAMTVGR